MTLKALLESKNITQYRLSKDSQIPYATINDIFSGKAQLEKCSAETVYRICKVLGVSMESLIAPCLDKRNDFEIFKSNMCHKLKELGDIDFIIYLLEEDEISKYYEKKWYSECLYLLAMLDYISRENNIPLCTKYDSMRKLKLKNTVYPTSVSVAARVSKNDELKLRSVKESIPEFIRFNIVESEIRNVI